MSSAGPGGGDVSAPAPPAVTVIGPRTDATPKLPSRTAAPPKQQHPPAADGPVDWLGDVSASASTCGAGPPSAAVLTPAAAVSTPSTAADADISTATPAAASSSSSLTAGGVSGPRPSAGPSLPSRTARPKTAAGAIAGSDSSGSNPPASSPAAPKAPAASTPPGPSASSGGSSSATVTAKTAPTVPLATAPASPAASGGGGGGAASVSGSGSGGGSARRAPMGGLFRLPLRPLAPPPHGPVLDPDEPESVAKVRRSVHAVRVQMISAALRLGYDHENALVKQVLYRLALTERHKAPWKRPGKRPDPVAAAIREAKRWVEEDPAAASASSSGSSSGSGGGGGSRDPSPLGFTVKIMLIGLQGSGKTQLAHALLGGSVGGGDSGSTGRLPHAAVHPFEGATRGVTVLRGCAPGGISLELVDTPGLSFAPGGASRNCRVLQQIRRSYITHRPDLLVYVDRLDAPTPAAGGPPDPGRPGGPGGGSTGGSGAELGVLRNLTAALGPAMWLNTIVTFTHAGSPPPTSSREPGPRVSSASSSSAPSGGITPHGGLSFERWLEVRSHALQGVIRQAGYDERLMNPVAFAESHPACPTNSAGQPVIYNGMPWRSHLLLMVTSAKLLADTEALLRTWDGAAGGGLAGLCGAGGGGGPLAAGVARPVPLSYIMQQVTQISRPLKFPDHRNVMDVRQARAAAGRLPLSRQRRDAARQVALRVLGLRQVAQQRRVTAESYRLASPAGCKLTTEPPRVAKRCRPSALPLEGFRYRAPQAGDGWVVRPNIEQHCADVSDGIEGFVLNKVAVAAPGRPGEADGLKGYGTPYHHYVSLQFTKEQRVLVARSEATHYHDPLGRATTSLSADLQTSAATAASGLGVGGVGKADGDVLVVLRSDTRLSPPKGSTLPKVTLGAVAARVGGESRLPLLPPGLRLPLPLRGSSALGVRVQAVQKARLGPEGAPLRLAVAAAALQRTSELAAGRLGLRGSGGGLLGGGDECCLGATAEAHVDLANLLDLPLARRLPGAVGATLMRSPEGDTSVVLSSSLEYKLGAREMAAVRATWDKRGRAGLSLRLKTMSGWWCGLLAMLLPLGRLAADSLQDGLRHLRAARAAAARRKQQPKPLQQKQQQGKQQK